MTCRDSWWATVRSGEVWFGELGRGALRLGAVGSGAVRSGVAEAGQASVGFGVVGYGMARFQQERKTMIQVPRDFPTTRLRRCCGCDTMRRINEMKSMGPYSRCIACRMRKYPPPEERMRLVRKRLDPGPLYDPAWIQ